MIITWVTTFKAINGDHPRVAVIIRAKNLTDACASALKHFPNPVFCIVKCEPIQTWEQEFASVSLLEPKEFGSEHDFIRKQCHS